MSENRWDEIKYSEVPGRAMMIYRKAFARHDEEGFNTYIKKAASREEKIHSATLYPYDIVQKILFQKEDSDVLEAQWKNLPNYAAEGTNAIVMADVSGSMTCSANLQVIELKGRTLAQKIACVNKAEWGMNTNLEAAFEKVLYIAVISSGHSMI